MTNSYFIKPEKKLVDDWIHRFMNFADLLNLVSGSDTSLSEGDDSKYSLHRRWFVSHEARFIPLWQRYLEIKREDSGGATGCDFKPGGNETADFINNPFRYYYRDIGLTQTFVRLGLQNSSGEWVSCDDQAGDLRTTLIGILGVAVEFHQWAHGTSTTPS